MCFNLLGKEMEKEIQLATMTCYQPLRAGIITYVSRRDELHVIKNLATLGERRLSGRLPCRRLKHRVREEKTVLQPDAGWELAGSHRFVLLAAGCRLGAS